MERGGKSAVDGEHVEDDSRQDRRKGIGAAAVIAAVSATWRIPVITTLLLLVLCAAGLTVTRAFLPRTTTFVSQFHFTFPTVEAGRYPNGMPFSLNELIDPDVLNLVYAQMDLDKFGLDRDKFYGAFAIRPFLLTEAEIADRYRAQLSDRRISFVERERIEQELKSRLEQGSRTAAELSFTVLGSVDIAAEIGRAIVQRVPLAWSQQAIETRGVLRVPGFSGSPNLIAQSSLDQQLLPLRIISLTVASHRLQDRLTELMKMPGVQTTLDPASHESIRDIERGLQDYQLFLMNPLLSSLVTYGFADGLDGVMQIIERRIADLQVQSADLDRQAEAISQTVDQFVRATVTLKGRAVEVRGSELGVQGGATIPQIGESFIDRLIDLTRRDRESEQFQPFIVDRTHAQYEMRRRAIAARTEQTEWQELLAQLRGTPPRKELDAVAEQRILQQLLDAVKQANAKWAALGRIEVEFASSRKWRTADLYALYATPRDIVVGDPILNWTVMPGAISALVAYLVASWVACMLFYLARNRLPAARVE